MINKDFLTKIWNLDKVDRPGIIIEEAGDREFIPDIKYPNGGKHKDFITKNMRAFNRIIRNNDDNIPAINTGVGTFIIPTAFGGIVRTFEDGHSYLEGPVIFDASDVDKIKCKPQFTTSVLGEQLEIVKETVEAADGKYPIRLPDIQNPLGVAAMLWDTNNFYTSLVEDSDKVHKLLEMITEVTIEFILKIREICPDIVSMLCPSIWAPPGKGVYLADDTMCMLSPAMYEEFGVTYNNKISRAMGGIMLHSCSTKEPYFRSILKNEGLMSINFAAQYSSDIKKIFDFFGGKVVVLPHYFFGDSPQIGTVIEFIDKVLDCWTPDSPTIIYVGGKMDGQCHEQVYEAFENRGLKIR